MSNIFKEVVFELICTTNGSSKFYNIKAIASYDINGTLYNILSYTAYGKIGTAVSYGNAVFVASNLNDTYNFIDLTIKSKIKKGYVFVKPYSYQILLDTLSLNNIQISEKNIVISTANDINNNILKAAEVKKLNKIKEELKYSFYSLESIRDLI